LIAFSHSLSFGQGELARISRFRNQLVLTSVCCF
jgi:hypothetical protein